MKEDDGWTKDTWAIDKEMTMGSESYGREWSIREYPREEKGSSQGTHL